MNIFFKFPKTTSVFFLFVVSFSINQYFGYVGVMPLDTFLVFNSAYDILLGYTPYKDFWVIKEVFIDLMQFTLFNFFGVSWFVYVMHASFMNSLLVISTFFIFNYFRLNNLLNIILCICISLIAYPLSGTPFSDFHSSIFSIVALYLFIFAIKSENNFAWFILPVIMMFGFFSKQTPIAYIILIISFLSIIYFIKNFNINKIICGFSGIVFSLSLILFYLIYNNINFDDFLVQNFLFPKTLGSTRLEWLFPIEFKRFFLRFKLIHLSTFFLILAYLKLVFLKQERDYKNKIILLSLYFSSIAFIVHQLMTINAIFIYFLVPIMIGFSFIYYPFAQGKIKKNFIKFLILISISTSIYYFNSYVKTRKFMDLQEVNLNQSVNGVLLDPLLKNIKWITPNYKDNAEQEIELLNSSLEILKNDFDKYMLITDYQIISVLLGKYDFAPIRFWYEFHGYPAQSNQYFDAWKDFFLKNVKKNKIRKFYILGSMHGSINPLDDIYGTTCQKEKKINDMLKLYTVNNCKDSL